MRLRHELAYDAPPAEVLTMLADPLFWDRAADATGALSSSTLTYDLDVKASVPLVGGKPEKLVVELTTAGFEKEQAVGAASLAGDRA